MNSSSLYEELFAALSVAHNSLICPICLEIILNPIQLNTCGHLFCQFCISKTNSTISTSQPCPVCNELFTRRDIVSAKEEFVEYRDMLRRLTVQFSKDIGYDVTLYAVDSPKYETVVKAEQKGKTETSVIKRRSSRGNSTIGVPHCTQFQKSKDNNPPASKDNIKNNTGDISVKELVIEQFSEEDLDVFVSKTKKTDEKYRLINAKAKKSKGKEILKVCKQNCSESNISLSKANNSSIEASDTTETFLCSPNARARVDFMNKVVKKVEDEVKSCEQDELIKIKKDEIYKNVPRIKTDKSNVHEKVMKSVKQEQTKNNVIGGNITEQLTTKRNSLLGLKTRSNNIEEEVKSSKQELIERRSDITSNNCKEEFSSNKKSEIKLSKNNIQEFNNQKQEEVLKEKIDVNDYEDKKKNKKIWKKNVPRSKGNTTNIVSKELNSSKQEMNKRDNQCEKNETDSYQNILTRMNMNKNILKKEKNNISKHEQIENKVTGSGDWWREDENEESYKKTTRNSKMVKNKIKEIKTSQQDKMNENDDELEEDLNDKKEENNKEEINNFKQNEVENESNKTSKREDMKIKCEKIVRSKLDETNIQNNLNRKSCRISLTETRKYKKDDCYKDEMITSVKKAMERKISESDYDNNIMEVNNTDEYKQKKRKRTGIDIKNKKNNVADLDSPSLQTPTKKRLCCDIGVQTSPSRLMLLYEEMKIKFNINSTTTQTNEINKDFECLEKCIEKSKNTDSPNSNRILVKHKTPVSVLNHSTPITDFKKVEAVDGQDDLTELAPKLKDVNCQYNILSKKNPDIGSLKTPLPMKISVLDNSVQGFSVISNPTVSEKKRFNNSKFLNDSFGVPGDSLLENSELSSSILQNTSHNKTQTELIESTPQTLNQKSKRTSRRLLEYYEGDSNSGDMFATNDEVLNNPTNPSLPLLETETCSEFPIVDVNKYERKIERTSNEIILSQKSEPGSESSSKENQKPEEYALNLDLRSDCMKSSESLSKNNGNKNVLKNLTPTNVTKQIDSGISQHILNQQNILTKNPDEIIEDSDDEEDKCVIEATPQKLSPPSQSTSSVNSSQSTTGNVKDFCFVTSSLLPPQLRCVKILAEVLGCCVNRSVTNETSHLIIQTCEKGRVKRTLKYLQALVLHKIVVSYNWVSASLEQKALLPVEPYIVYDTWGAPAVHRSLNNCGNYLLKNFAISVVEPTMEINLTQVEELIDACGAIIIKDPRCFNFVPPNLLRIILTDKEDAQKEAIVWLNKYKAVSLRVDWLVSSIAQYEISSLMCYLLVPLEAKVLLMLGFPEWMTVEDNDDIAD